jgi:ABC-type nitrate/sulfonate/bicarbonate transport system substrate-binding protein
MFKNKKIFIIIIAVILGILALVYFVWRFLPVKKVVVGPKWVNQAQFAGLFVAKDKGIYRKYGLDTSFREFSSDVDLFSDLVNGKTDFTITSAEEYLLARDKGLSVMAVSAYYQSSPYAIVSLTESGIKNPADFKGKVLGNKSGKVEESLIYELLLNSVGLTTNDVQIKILGFDKKEMENLVMKNADVIDLYRTDQLYFFDKEGIKYNIIYPEQFGIGTFNDVLVTRIDLIKSDPALVRNFVRASSEGWEEAFKNKSKAVDYTLNHVTSNAYKDRDYEMYILEQSEPLIKPNSNNRIGIMDYIHWDRLYREMKTRKFITKEFSVNDLFTNEFLP